MVAPIFLCVCKAIRVSEAVYAARAGVDTPTGMRQHFGFDDDECCGRCAKHIDSVAHLVQIKLRQIDEAVAPTSLPALR